MSAAQNKRLMQEIFAKAAIGDGSSFVAHLADDVTMRVTGQYSWSQTFKGKQSVLRDRRDHGVSGLDIVRAGPRQVQ